MAPALVGRRRVGSPLSGTHTMTRLMCVDVIVLMRAVENSINFNNKSKNKNVLEQELLLELDIGKVHLDGRNKMKGYRYSNKTTSIVYVRGMSRSIRILL